MESQVDPNLVQQPNRRRRTGRSRRGDHPRDRLWRGRWHRDDRHHDACERLGRTLTRAYQDATLRSGQPGAIRFTAPGSP